MKKLFILTIYFFLTYFVSAQNSFGDAKAMPLALKGDIFFIDEIKSLPNFDELEKIGTIYAEELNIEPRDFKDGFPGISKRNEWFAIRYTGGFNLNANGNFLFELGSDDGSKLFIDSILIINNDGLHSPQIISQELFLNKGKHSIELQYFQGPRFEIALGLFFSYEKSALIPFSIEKIETLTPKLKTPTFKKVAVKFEYDQHKSRNDITVPLKNMLEFLKHNEGYKIKLSGYSDSKGSNEYNLELAKKRISNVCQLIYSLMPKQDITSDLLLNPIGETTEEKSKEEAENNRRVDIELVRTP